MEAGEAFHHRPGRRKRGGRGKKRAGDEKRMEGRQELVRERPRRRKKSRAGEGIRSGKGRVEEPKKKGSWWGWEMDPKQLSHQAASYSALRSPFILPGKLQRVSSSMLG